jgi:hypothetical protein
LTTIDTPAASIVRSLLALFGIGSLDVGPRVFIFRKRAAPAVGEIKDRHVKYEQRVVPTRARSKEVAQPALEIVFTLFGFHCGFVSLQRYRSLRPVTTLQSRDFGVPLLRETKRTDNINQ